MKKKVLQIEIMETKFVSNLDFSIAVGPCSESDSETEQGISESGLGPNADTSPSTGSTLGNLADAVGNHPGNNEVAADMAQGFTSGLNEGLGAAVSQAAMNGALSCINCHGPFEGGGGNSGSSDNGGDTPCPCF